MYKVVKKKDGQSPRDWNVIDTFDNIEDARKQLATELMYAGDDDYRYFATKEDAESEIKFAEDARADWGNERVHTYISALNEGINAGTPFIANSVTGDYITLEYDSFSYDNYTIEIEEN